MKYLITDKAKQISVREAIRRECWRALGIPNGMSLYWWGWREHPETKELALQVPEDEVQNLTQDERDNLIDELPEGWTPKEDII